MKILLIDNRTKHLKEFRDLIEGCGHTADVIPFTEASSTIANHYDLSIITGSNFTISRHIGDFTPEIAMIENITKPLLGICHGFELIAHTFGAKLHHWREKLQAIVEINVTKQDPIFDNLCKFRAYEAHKYYVKSLPDDLIELARSEYNIEVLKHKSRPIYGFQFHPEVIAPSNKSTQIFLNLLGEIEKMG